ncbi:M15 family metallopeptidase [Candidatus Palauibacter sp.]|uniref:M15 family metallopeptidase n=1 Tax=Candidatus Palauibacter sp. TaxID=3101350 RepID=UPI003B5CC9AC
MALSAALLTAAAACAPDAGTPGTADPGAGVAPRADYAEVAAALTSMIERERDQKGLEAFSIALVDEDDIVWAAGFGAQDPERGIPASAETVYRVGSVSKLFTDIAVMQLVERGELDLDAPVRQYLPGFAPENASGRILQPETLESMWEPQFAAEGAASGYGLGFAVEERFGQRWLGHGGAIYGFSTQLAFLPESGIGVVAVSAVDGTNTVTGRVADAALELMLAARAGAPLPEAPLLGTDPIDPALALVLEGVYGTGEEAVELDARGSRLALTPLRGGATLNVRTRGDTLIVDDRLAFGARYLREGDDLLALGDAPANAPEAEPRRLARRPEAGPPPQIPARWAGLIGEYGWDHNVLYILEREGRLHALIEWFFLYPLEEVSRDAFAFPDRGLYHGERLVFTRGAEGRATAVEAASVRFGRREVGTEAGGTFRIDPVRPVEDLRAEAPAASPPTETGSFRESELVEVTSIEPGIRLDVRYATTNNFMSSVFYDEPRVFLQRPAAEAVARAHRALAAHGYGLLLHDGYRPWYVTKMFWDATPESDKIFVADPASGSRHNRGSAIDLNLFDLATGEPVDMVGTYDEFSPRSFPDYPGGTSRQRWLRELLRRAMEAEGFTVYEAEWWHFDHEDWRSYAIQNATFDELRR